MQMLLELDKEKEKKKSWRGKKKIKKGKTGIKVAKLWVPCQKKKNDRSRQNENKTMEERRFAVKFRPRQMILYARETHSIMELM